MLGGSVGCTQHLVWLTASRVTDREVSAPGVGHEDHTDATAAAVRAEDAEGTPPGGPRRPPRMTPDLRPAAYASRPADEDPQPSPAGDEAVESLPAPKTSEASGSLELQTVIASVQTTFPLLQAALQERAIAGGKELAAAGEFDRTLQMYGLAAPLGYYKNYRSGVLLEQPTLAGGYLYGGYRNGSGYFPEWYKNRLTNEGGEFTVGLGAPLAQNRAIDKRRAGVRQSALARAAVEPEVQAQLLQFVQAAAEAYWSWMAAGQMLQAQRDLLALAQDRVRQIEDRIRSGDLETNARIDNERLIATREIKLLEVQRKVQASAIKLSLFLRTPEGEPQVPGDERLPADFPEHQPPEPEHLERDVQTALEQRPELVELDLLYQQVSVELQQAENLLLPKVDARLEASKDVGAPSDEKGDKTPFQLEAGLLGELPLQRREARGKIQAARGKLAQVAAKREFAANKVVAEVRDATSALHIAHGRIQRARANHQLAHESLDLGRQAFQAGDLTVVTLNLYEQAVLDAELQLIEAQADYFRALAEYQAALAIPPPGTPGAAP